MFLFEKRKQKKKARRKPLSTPKLAHIANEHKHMRSGCAKGQPLNAGEGMV